MAGKPLSPQQRRLLNEMFAGGQLRASYFGPWILFGGTVRNVNRHTFNAVLKRQWIVRIASERLGVASFRLAPLGRAVRQADES